MDAWAGITGHPAGGHPAGARGGHPTASRGHVEFFGWQFGGGGHGPPSGSAHLRTGLSADGSRTGLGGPALGLITVTPGIRRAPIGPAWDPVPGCRARCHTASSRGDDRDRGDGTRSMAARTGDRSAARRLRHPWRRESLAGTALPPAAGFSMDPMPGADGPGWPLGPGPPAGSAACPDALPGCPAIADCPRSRVIRSRCRGGSRGNDLRNHLICIDVPVPGQDLMQRVDVGVVRSLEGVIGPLALPASQLAAEGRNIQQQQFGAEEARPRTGGCPGSRARRRSTCRPAVPGPGRCAPW